MSAKIEGVAEVVAALDDVPVDLNREVVDQVRGVAEGIAKSINIPEYPLSGFESGWDGVNVDTFPGKNRSKSEWYIHKVLLRRGMATMADMASDGRSGRGISMVDSLTDRYGGASRWVWDAARMRKDAVELSMDRAAKKVEHEMTRRVE